MTKETSTVELCATCTLTQLEYISLFTVAANAGGAANEAHAARCAFLQVQLMFMHRLRSKLC